MEQPELFASLRGPPRRPVRWLRHLLLLVLLLSAAASVVLWGVNRPEVLEAIVRWGLDDPTITVSFDDLTVDPETGRVTVSGLHFSHPDPMTPTIDVGWASLAFPMPSEWGHQWVIADAYVVGLQIHAHRQRPPPPWEPSAPWVTELRVEHAQVVDADWKADRDLPLEAASVHRIAGTIDGLRYAPGPRSLSGAAELTADSFRTGALRLTRLHMSVVAEDSELTWKDARFNVAGGHGRVTGRVSELFRTPAVKLTGNVEGLALGKLVRMATGQPSPIEGTMAGSVTILSGGRLPRGDARVDAELQLTDAHLPLELAPGKLVKTLLRLTTLVTIGQNDEVHFQDLSGRLAFGRGHVTVDHLAYASKREIRVDGEIDEVDGVNLLVRQARARPAKNPGLVKGIGETLSSLAPEVILGEEGEKARIVWPRFGKKARLAAEEAREAEAEAEPTVAPEPASDEPSAYGFVVSGSAGDMHLRLATPQELGWGGSAATP